MQFVICLGIILESYWYSTHIVYVFNNVLNLLVIKLLQPSTLNCSFSSLKLLAYCVAETTCNGNGTCGLDGICQCDKGLTGSDCTDSTSKSIYNRN